MRLASNIRASLKVEVSLQSIFDLATLRELAIAVEQAANILLRPALLKVERDTEVVPPSFAQQRLWFIDSLQGGSPEYNMPMAFDVDGQLDIGLVTAVFNSIIERHEVLRTVYVEQAGEALQYIRSLSDVHFDIKYDDLSQLSGKSLDAEVRALVELDITTAFNLAEDLMLRVSYIKTGHDKGVLLFNMHHIASDGWSMEVLTKEFLSLYQAYSEGRSNPLAPLEVQYADYAYWQRDYLKGEVLASQLDYWCMKLDELPAVHSLQLDYSRPVDKQHVGGMVKGELTPNVAQGLLAVAKAHQITPFMLLHGALSLLLSRHSNTNDIVVGTPVANRLQAELEPLIGFFVNTLVLRADTSYTSLSDYFAHIRQVHLEAQSNQDVPFEQLVETLKVPRSTAHSPLFQIMMTTNTDYGLDDGEASKVFELPGVGIQPYGTTVVTAKFDLDISLNISEQGVGLNWVYDKSLFSESHVEQLNGHLCNLLTALSEVGQLPEQTLQGLEMLSADEIQHLVYDLNNTAMDYPKDKCIHELFEEQARDNPG
ncbi:MAG: non-ribosomal peptide synthetase, partial [Pseudoalteromonas sp.]|nr:non-ribosomal peptide synthetase [Pseudoalteromonas sp.]